MWDINVNDITLFLENETNFNHNQYVLSDCISAMVTETTDGILDLDLEYPLKDSKNISGLLKRKNILKCKISTTDSRGEQLFKIRTATPNTANTTIKVYAQAIARRDLDKFNMVVDLKTTPGITRKQAMQEILNHCAKSHNFHIGNLDTNTNTNINMGYEEETGNAINYLTINGYSPRKAFLDETENSIFKAWGGEIIWNNFEINMVDERGTDNTIIIESGKNLEELEQSIDDTDLDNFITAIMPVSSDGVYLPNHEIIYSPNHAILEGGFDKLVCDDVSLVENAPDQQQAFNVLYAQLRDRVQKKFNEGIDKLKINNTVKFVQLANTEEYKDFAVLEKCEIGNNVIVRYYDPYDPEKKTYIEAIGRVLKIKFNVLTNRIEEVEIGDRKKQNILNTITATVNKTTNLNDKSNTNKANIKVAKKEAIEKSKGYTDDVKATLQEADNAIIIDVDNYKTNMDTRLSVMDGEINARVTSEHFNTEIDLLDGKINTKVEESEFGTYIEQNSRAIVETIHGATDNKTTLDENGLTITGGGFKFEDSDGNELIKAIPSGGMRLGDPSWNKRTVLEMLNLGGSPLSQYFMLSNIYINDELNMGENNFVCNEASAYLGDVYIHGQSLRSYIDERIANHSSS